jgi:hypothetical protein
MTINSITQDDVLLTSALSRSTVKNLRFGISRINLFLLIVGVFFYLAAEISILPLAAALLYFYIGKATLWLSKSSDVWERRMYARIFCVGFTVSGLSALYRSFSGDLQGDAVNFFENASFALSGWSLQDIALVTEGSLAVILWRTVFDIMALLGFPREQYVGILINVLFIALNGVLALKMARLIFGNDCYRFRRLILLFSLCGLFWLFSGILIRDSLVLLGVNFLLYFWIKLLRYPKFNFHLILLVFVSILGFIYFGFMRAEFIFVPFALALAGTVSLFLGKNLKSSRHFSRLFFVTACIALGTFFFLYGSDLLEALLKGQESYGEAGSSNHGDGSLGMALIVNQSMPIRLLAGSIYLFIFPIPIWSGFQFESAYHLFKSFNAIFNYYLIPLICLAFLKLWKHASERSPIALFLVFTLLGFTIAIAGTSLETRHLGAFIVPALILALFPDLRIEKVNSNYWQLFFALVGCIFVIHYLWIFLKLGSFIIPATLLFLFLILAFEANSKARRGIYSFLFVFVLLFAFA